MNRLSVGILSNFFGQTWAYALQLMLVPFYLRILGLEAYGLIGLLAVLMTTVQIFDFGLTPTLTREISRRAARPESGATAATVLLTFQTVYFFLALALGTLLYVGSPLLAKVFAKPPGLSADQVEGVLKLMAGIITVQWAHNVYVSVLSGLQRQVTLNVLRVSFTTLTTVGAVVTLLLVSPTIEALFIWQLISGLLSFPVTALIAWSAVRPTGRASGFSVEILTRAWRFAAGTATLNVLGLTLSQVDKWILASMLPLERFAFYSLASSVSNAVYGIVLPVIGVLFPRFVALYARGQEGPVRDVYHLGTQLVATLAIPAALTVSLFAPELLRVWTRNALVVENAAPILSILILGTMLNCLMLVPYNLQLAAGWTRIGVTIAGAFILVFTPAVVISTHLYGGVGAAATWLALNLAYFSIGVWLTHRRLLRGEVRYWYLHDVLPPLIASLGVLMPVRAIMPDSASAPVQAIIVVAGGALALLASALAAPDLRSWIVRHVARRPGRAGSSGPRGR